MGLLSAYLLGIALIVFAAFALTKWEPFAQFARVLVWASLAMAVLALAGCG